MCCIVGIWQLQVSPWNSPEKVIARAREHFEPWNFSTLFGRHQPNKFFLNKKTSGWGNFTPFSLVKYPFPFWNLWPLRYWKNTDSQKLLHLCFSCFRYKVVGAPLGSVLPHRFTFFWPGRTWLLPSRKWCIVSRSLSWAKGVSFQIRKGIPFLQVRSTGWSKCYKKIDRKWWKNTRF